MNRNKKNERRLTSLITIRPHLSDSEISHYRAEIDSLTGLESFIARLLHASLQEQDYFIFEQLVYVASRHPSTSYTATLCRALAARSFDINSDDIVTALGEARDPLAVPCLIDALWWHPDWDEFHQLARKCVWALSRIGTAEAIGAIVESVRIGPSHLYEFAMHELTELTRPDERQVRATFDSQLITVYQAFSPEIAESALANGRLSPPFKLDRMTWIRPSLLWMAYRSEWATKPNQERVLAIDIVRARFDEALATASLSSFDPAVHSSFEEWRERANLAPVKVQWDPDRTAHMVRLPWRCIQIGLGSAVTRDYALNWTSSIRDITSTVHAIRDALENENYSEVRRLMPAEDQYPLPVEAGQALGLTRT